MHLILHTVTNHFQAVEPFTFWIIFAFLFFYSANLEITLVKQRRTACTQFILYVICEEKFQRPFLYLFLYSFGCLFVCIFFTMFIQRIQVVSNWTDSETKEEKTTKRNDKHARNCYTFFLYRGCCRRRRGVVWRWWSSSSKMLYSFFFAFIQFCLKWKRERARKSHNS